MAEMSQSAAADAENREDQPSHEVYLLRADIVWMGLLAVVVAVNF